MKNLRNVFTRIGVVCLILALLACAVACGKEDAVDTDTQAVTTAETTDAATTEPETTEPEETEENLGAYTDGISDDTAADIF